MLLFIGRSWNHLVPCFPSAPRGQWLPARPGDAEIDIAWTYNAEPQWDGGRCRVSSSGAASSSMVANIRGWNPDWMVRPQRGYQVGGSIGPLYQRHCRMTSGTATKLTEFRGPPVGRGHTRATPARSLMTSSSFQSSQDRFRLAYRESVRADRRSKPSRYLARASLSCREGRSGKRGCRSDWTSRGILPPGSRRLYQADQAPRDDLPHLIDQLVNDLTGRLDLAD